MSGDPKLERIAKGDGAGALRRRAWTASFAPVLERMVADAEKLGGSRPNIFIDVSEVAKLDTFGAWLIERLRRSLTQGAVEAQIAGLSANYSSLVDEVRRVKADAGRRQQRGDHHRHAGPDRPQRGRYRRHVGRADRHARRGARGGRARADPSAQSSA